MLGIPSDYLVGEIALVPQCFIEEIVSAPRRGVESSTPLSFEFKKHPHLKSDDVRALITERQTPARSGEGDDEGATQEWHLVRLERFPKKTEAFAYPLPGWRSQPLGSGGEPEERSYAESLEYVALANFARTWKDAHGGHGHDEFGLRRSMDRHKYDDVLRLALKRVYDHGSDTGSHVEPALVVLEDADAFVVVHLLRNFSLRDAVDFSPSFLSSADTYQKPLFVTYQLLHATRELHSRGMSLGDITLSDVTVDHNYYVTVRPKVVANVAEVEERDCRRGSDNLVMEETSSIPIASSTLPSNSLGPGTLSGALDLWRAGRLSNFDYLMFLNYLCGRSCDNPSSYPVLPWVRDFSSEIGGWRDLSKSKFRINKGDQMLDITYNTLSEQGSIADATPSSMVISGANTSSSHSSQQVQPPHHVTEVLSEITHYVYKARRTSRSVLCKHVRNRWVPAEYPSSIERLQAWTPDECIPDFYVDPSIFRSLHIDLPNLELPSWCKNSPEDFIRWHRASLESNHVSDKLHLWIDLTFGYKLSGGSAVRAKNVCLPLVDGHCDLRRHGVVQIFTHPHPSKEVPSQFWRMPAPPPPLFVSSLVRGSSSSDSDSEGAEEDRDGESSKLTDVKDREEKWKTQATASIVMPKDFEPMLRLNELESLHTFLMKCNQKAVRRKSEEMDCKSSNFNITMTDKSQLLYRTAVRDMQVIGCLIMELFMPKKFVALGAHASPKARYEMAVAMLRHEEASVPLCIRQTAKKLLHRDCGISTTNKYPSINDAGLPQPTAFQLLCNSLSSLHFPAHFSVLAKILRSIDASQVVPFQSQLNVENIREVAEFRVKLAASELQPLYKNLRADDLLLLLPMVKSLFLDTSTAVLAAWYMFEPFGRILGPQRTRDNLLYAMLAIYEGSVQTSKHLKLYHRSFLQFLMLRFGTATFLRYFSTYLIEAVGGYKDFEDNGLKSARLCRDSDVDVELESDSDEDTTPKEERLAEGEVFPFDADNSENSQSNDMAKNLASRGEIYIPEYKIPQHGEDFDETGEEKCRPPSSAASSAPCGGNIAQVASESVLWLAHKIGPILTAKYLARNLLRMLNLCYATMSPEEGDRRRRLLRHPDNKIRVGFKRQRGDVLAQNVLNCLSEIACLYGDQIVLLQYLPYSWDLVTLCKRRMTPNLEGGLIGCVELTHHIIPYLSDSVLMNELPDNIVANVLIPALQIATSRTASFSGGAVARKTLLYKCLDVIYMVGLRIGEEMARSHLSQFSSAFFSSFDKVWDSTGRQLKISDNETAPSLLSEALDSELAYAAYIAFYNLMGRSHLEDSIINLGVIRNLCLQEQEASPKEPVARPIAFNCYMRLHHNSGGGEAARESMSSPDSGALAGNSNQGNRIEATSGSSSSACMLTAMQSRMNDEIHSLISKPSSVAANTSRHLRGNWLAYWEHEIGRGAAEKRFNLKQIKLQTFSGHSAVRALHVLENESSFLSAGSGRDKSVKVWSLRSQGDGNATIGCQWSYGHHKKSIFSVSYLESLSLAVSCDSGSFHVWDPFVGSPVSQVDPGEPGGSFLGMTMLPSPSPIALVAAQDRLRMIDTRMGKVASDLKVSIMGATGQVKVLAARDSLLIAGHATGYISLLDTRTGKLRNAWKAHEGEVLTVTPLENTAPASAADFVSSSLDQNIRFWNSLEGGKLVSSMAVQDPVHCASLLNGELIFGSQANRISVRHVSGDNAQVHSNKLRSDVIKGNLTSMKALEMNRMLLLGLDNGQTVLMC